jgi:glycosyltransferase involved in cell wall biosynthesis
VSVALPLAAEEVVRSGAPAKQERAVTVTDLKEETTGAGLGLRVVVLVPAYNKAGSIAATLDGLMGQERPADLIVVVPNGCTDATAWEARKYPLTVMELPRLEHRKSEALNRAWAQYAYDADVVVCLDADTVLPPNALAAWEREFAAEEGALLGGSSSKFTMQDPGLLSRLQKAEFATWTDTPCAARKRACSPGPAAPSTTPSSGR